MSELRVGLIGFGHGGAVFHAPLVAATPGLVLSAIVTANAERRERAARDYPTAAVIEDARQLWERASDLDLVVIASPNRSHAPLAVAALEAGLDVVVDKPFAVTSADARAVMALARRLKRRLTVFHNRRWDGDFLTVRRLIAEGAVGNVQRFESRFERWRPAPRPGWREQPASEDGGGLLFDLGTHLIDQALLLFGPVAAVHAELDRRRPGVMVEDDAFVALTHASGVRSHLWMSSVAAQAGPRFRVLGSRAGFTKYGMDVQEDALRAGARPGHEGWGEDEADRYGTLGAGDSVDPVPTERGAYERFYALLLAAVRDGGPPPVDPQDAVDVLEIVERIRAANASRG